MIVVSSSMLDQRKRNRFASVPSRRFESLKIKWETKGIISWRFFQEDVFVSINDKHMDLIDDFSKNYTSYAIHTGLKI